MLYIKLSSTQFLITSIFSAVFCALNLGLSLIAVINTIKSKQRQVMQSKFWMQILYATYSIFVISMIILLFQLATNWAPLAGILGSTLGPILSIITLTMLTIEALLIMTKIHQENKKLIWAIFILMHVLLWMIICAQNLLYNPSGIEFDYINNYTKIISFKQIIFNQSILQNFLYALLLSYLTCAIFIMSVSAYFFLKNKHIVFAINATKVSVIIGLACSIIMISNLENVDTINAKQTIALHSLRINNGMQALQAMRNLKKEYTQSEKEIFLMHKHDIPYALLVAQLQPTERLIGTSFETILPSVEEISQETIANTAREMIPNINFINTINKIMKTFLATLTCLFSLLFFLLLRKKLAQSKNILKICITSLPLPVLLILFSILKDELLHANWAVFNMIPTHLIASKLKEVSIQTSLCGLILFLIAALIMIAARIMNIINTGPLPQTSANKIFNHKTFNSKAIYSAQIKSRAVLKKLNAKKLLQKSKNRSR